jgi:LacI family transcriptional regulator, galactose operon repressor
MKKTSHPTLDDVAHEAGVGTTTVSRVINGGDRVSPKTLARVLQVIERLGYRPNQAARILKGHRARTVGLVIPNIADPFFASCAEAAYAVARANDSLLIVTATHNDLDTELENLDVLISHRTDGLLIAPANPQSKPLRDVLSRIAIPVVAIDRPVPNVIASVVVDNYQAANAATQHLIAHGYKRIACLTGETMLYTIRERIRGYRRAVEAAGLPCILDISVNDYRSVESAIRNLLSEKHPPQALFTLKNSITIHAFEALQKLNVPVPAVLALLGFDDFELASTLRPSISVVQQPIDEIGRVAAELLFHRLLEGHHAGNAAHSRRNHLVKLKTRFIERRSCGCAPGTGRT